MLTRAALKWTFLVAPLALTFPLAHADPVRVTEQVTVIVDGDTVILGNGDKIRYVGVDTPERDEPLYDEATAYNRKMVFGKNVSIWSCTARPYDKHARRLATLKMGNLDVSVEMVR
ncbi:thermonuclease family protein, partial [bacterium]|nr:thermonuclease family protein [bacterium]